MSSLSTLQIEAIIEQRCLDTCLYRSWVP